MNMMHGLWLWNKRVGMVEKQAVVENGVQKIRITAEKGYSQRNFNFKKGSC